jgi:Glycosyl transferase family 11
MRTQSKKVIVKLKGGMGNQMFQYAFGRAVEAAARRHGETIDLQFDDTAYVDPVKKDTLRPFYLGYFNIPVTIASLPDITAARNPFGALSKAWRALKQKLDIDTGMVYDPALLRPPYRSYYDGYWQSEKFFAGMEDQIRTAFTFKDPLGPEAQRFHDQIVADPYAVSIFYRRTDYVGSSIFDIGEQAYQERAIARMRELVPSGRLYVMSDDITWVQENANLPEGSVFVSSPKVRGQGETHVPIPPHEEMQLLAACKHNIIPNSTYAWWGAWLNKNPDKQVIAPKEWARRSHWQFKDIVPERWIRV